MTNEELDHWLAEEVMGWRILKWHEDSWTGLNGLATGYSPYEREYGDPDEHWQPTRRIEQAMMAARVLIKRGWHFFLEIDRWYGAKVRFDLMENGCLLAERHFGRAEEPAEAICRAVEAAWETGGDADAR